MPNLILSIKELAKFNRSVPENGFSGLYQLEKIWIDISSLQQARLLCYIAKTLSSRCDVLVTCSALPEPQAVLNVESIPFRQIDHLSNNTLKRYSRRIMLLSDVISETKPDLLLTDLDPSAVRTAFGLGIPSWSIFRKPLNLHNNLAEKMSYPLCEKVFASSFFNQSEITELGVSPDRIVPFNGWNECYLKEHAPIQDLPPERAKESRILIRFNGNSQKWLTRLTRRILREFQNPRITLLCTDNHHMVLGNRLGLEVTRFQPTLPPLGQNVFIGWGRMLAESFVLGVPTVGTGSSNHSDLGLLYDSIPSSDDAGKLAQRCIEFSDEDQRHRFSMKSRAVVDSLESPLSAMLSEMR